MPYLVAVSQIVKVYIGCPPQQLGPCSPTFEGHSRSQTHVNWLPMTSYLWSMVTMGLSCTVSEIRSTIFVPHMYFTLPLILSPLEFCNAIWAQKTITMGLPHGEKSMTSCSHLDTMPKCDRETDKWNGQSLLRCALCAAFTDFRRIKILFPTFINYTVHSSGNCSNV